MNHLFNSNYNCYDNPTWFEYARTRRIYSIYITMLGCLGKGRRSSTRSYMCVLKKTCLDESWTSNI